MRITGTAAAFASRSTVSHPVSTTGENAMTSTRCAMKERSALIWFSCFCWASENFRRIPALARSAADRPLVLAVRHSLSAPIWLKPRTISRGPPPAASFFWQPLSSAPQAQRGAKANRVQSSHHPIFPLNNGTPAEHAHLAGCEARRRDRERVDERRAERRQLDLELIARLDADAVREAQRRRAEEMQVHVPGHTVRGVFEMMELEVRERVTHVLSPVRNGFSQRTVSPRRMRLRPSRVRGQRTGAQLGPTPHWRSLECARYR